MKKKVTISFVFILCIVAVIMVVSRTKKEEDIGRNKLSVSSGNSFGSGENDDKDNEAWLFCGDKTEKRIENCIIKCEIKSGGLVLIVYDNNGYSYLDKDKFVKVREEVITKSGEHTFDFSDLPDGIYSFCIVPQNIGDEAKFQYTAEYYEELR